MILGLTGGFGCGKSTAARLFERLGFRNLDSDALVREHVYARPEVRAALQERFGPEALLPDGTINRVFLGGIVFADDAQRLWLEDLTHPRLFELWRERLATDPGGRWVIEVLPPSNWPGWSSAVWHERSPSGEFPSNCPSGEKLSCPIMSC
jgi:dephospho-CoA kinase